MRTNAVVLARENNLSLYLHEHCRSETATEATVVGEREMGDAQ